MGDLLRRRGLMVQAGSSPIGPLYPFVNGTHNFTYANIGTLTITNGNHYEFVRSSGNFAIFANVSVVSQNGRVSNNADTNINNKPKLFTLPAGSLVTLKLKNIVATRISSNTAKWAFGVRGTASTTISGLSTGDRNPNPSPDTITVSTTISSDTDVGCLFFYAAQTYSKMAADVELWVNDVRYI